MTIAAGFKVRDGVILCADTEYSGGSKAYDVKITRHSFDNGALAIALAGNATNAGMAIRDFCYDIGGKRHSARSLEKSIRRSVLAVHDTYIKRSDDYESARFELILGVRFDHEQPYLLASTGPGVDSVSDYTTRGSGWPIADYIIKQSFNPFLPLGQVAIIALRFLAAAKRHMANVSGPSQFISITDNEISETLTDDFSAIEERIHQLEQAYGSFMAAMSDVTMDDVTLGAKLDKLKEDSLRVHADWRRQYSGLRDFLEKLGATAAAQSNLQSPTGDSSPQPPSPELP